MSVFTGTELSHEMGMVGLMVSGMSGVSRMANIMNDIITFVVWNTLYTLFGLLS